MISAIVPTHNRVAALQQCLAALRRQTMPRDQYEIIIIDDSSADGTAAWLAAQSDLVTLRTAHRGAAAARNVGARQARGALLAFTDDDCVAPPDWLSALQRELLTCDVVGGRVVNAVRDNGCAETAQAIIQMLSDELNVTLRDGGMLTSNNVAYRREAFMAAGGFDERFTIGGEDRELHYRLWRRGASLRYAPHIVVAHHAHLTIRQFWRQQFNYGRGAYHFYRTTPRPAHLPLLFYVRLVARMGQGQPIARRAQMLSCLVWSQAAVLCGYWARALESLG
jgi:GT2 family glycosyltransferase